MSYMSAEKPKKRRKGGPAQIAREGQYVVEDLRKRIANQVIPPGTKLLELQLAQEFNISRTRVREVLSALELRGLVKREPNKGAFVVKLELTEVFEIYDVREVLEGLSVRLATDNAPSETWQELIEIFGEPMEKMVAANDLENYEKNYAQMRQRVIEFARNPVLAAMLDSIYEKTRTIMRRVIILPGRAKKGLMENRAVLAAMHRGDSVEAEILKRANIRSGINDLKRYQDFVL